MRAASSPPSCASVVGFMVISASSGFRPAFSSASLTAAKSAGAEDVTRNEDGSVEVVCAPADFAAVKEALEKAGLKPELAEITMKPTSEAQLAGDDAARMRQLLDALENLDDVQNVYTTAVVD